MGQIELSEEDLAELVAYRNMKANQRRNAQRRAAKTNIILVKAKAAGITISEDEIDRYLEEHQDD